MRGALLVLACCALAMGGIVASAQEGHPLRGSWIGEWTGNEAHGNFVLLVLDWNGESVTGIINPGTDNIPIADASLDPEDWAVRIEAEAENGAGETLRYIIEATIVNLHLPNRALVGTWQSEAGSGAFEVRRQ
jgi:hypothetical protein